MDEYRYRCTIVTTADYGDERGEPNRTAIATLAIIPDGSHWQSRPDTLKIEVPEGTRPGDIYRVTITLEAPNA